jgi:multidrug efflux pump subunit AcrA (membrane-fusion protein)
MNAYPGLRAGTLRPGSGRARRHISRLQRAAAALIVGACVFAAAWYVPGIVAANGRSLTGTVTSNGIIYLNFAGSGQLAAIAARAGQLVRKGQLLATEAEPAMAAVMAADRAAITADQAQVAAALAAGASPAIATARAARQGPGPAGRRPCAGRRDADRGPVRRDRSRRQRTARRDRRRRGRP